MSFITRCPACGTAFKVVSDQLKISDGWVRCGHCQHIFDAGLDLQPWTAGGEAPVDRAVPPAFAPDVAPESVFEPTEAVADTVFEVADDDPEPGVAEAEPHSASPSWSVEPEFDVTEIDRVPTSASLLDADNDAVVPGEAPDHADPKPSFVRQAERKAVWRRPWVRGVSLLVVLFLLLLLVLQAALHWRDALAARWPRSIPLLQGVCLPLGCRVQPLMQIEAVSIESSALLRQSPGQFVFDMVVKNAAAQPVATPALELTLTDIDDRVLVRRVLLAPQWPEPRPLLAANTEWPVRLRLSLAGQQTRAMAGYRAVLFYP